MYTFKITAQQHTTYNPNLALPKCGRAACASLAS